MIASKKPDTDRNMLLWDGSTITLFGGFEELEPGVYSVSGSPFERFRVEKFTTYIPLLVDEFKPLFGLPKIGRHRLEYLDNTVFLLNRELGTEHSLEDSNDYDVFKTRLFRWIFGLPTKFVYQDILVRKSYGVTEIISYKDEKIDFSRPDPHFVKDLKVELAIAAMLYGYSLSSLRTKLNEIIRRINPSFIWVTGEVISRLSLYGFLTDDQD